MIPGGRFGGLYAQVWAALPPHVRRQLQHSWDAREPLIRIDRVAPEFYGKFYAPRNFYFARDFVNEASEEAVLFVIAHELAHSYRWAIGVHDSDDYDAEEAATDETAESWGFCRDEARELQYRVKTHYAAILNSEHFPPDMIDSMSHHKHHIPVYGPDERWVGSVHAFAVLDYQDRPWLVASMRLDDRLNPTDYNIATHVDGDHITALTLKS